MKKKTGICFIVIFMAICLLPFVCMIFATSNTTTENRSLAAFPRFVDAGKVNVDYLSELGDYFNDHFAFRQALVNTDAVIQTKVFRVSNAETVIAGKNGWLYYSATLDDYLGQNLMSDRSIYNAVHNLAMMQDYVEDHGAEFMVAIAPNKNSLYGENMPYYDSQKASNEKNADNMMAEMEEQGVPYTDLFTAFESEEEVLYLKRDSHWNGKGAVLAYNEILNSLYIDHDFLDTVTALRTKTEIGDLNSMVYPLSAKPEWNYTYEYDENFKYVTDTGSVEDAWIETKNPKGKSSLLMFRDSFGNTLLPLMANNFSEGYFSKGVPYSIEAYTKECKPDIVVVEKAERNIDEFASDPPIMQGSETELHEDKDMKDADTRTTCDIDVSENDTSYVCISGIIDKAAAGDRTNIYVRLQSGKTVKTFESFLTTTDDSDYGYTLYISKDKISKYFSGNKDKVTVQVIAETDGDMTSVYKEKADFTEVAED